MRASLMHTLHKRCQMFFKVKGLGNGMFSSLQSLHHTVSRQKEIFIWLLYVALPSFIPITFVPSFSAGDIALSLQEELLAIIRIATEFVRNFNVMMMVIMTLVNKFGEGKAST